MNKSTETVTISYIFKCLGYMLETHYIQSQSKSYQFELYEFYNMFKTMLTC